MAQRNGAVFVEAGLGRVAAQSGGIGARHHEKPFKYFLLLKKKTVVMNCRLKLEIVI